MMSDRNWLFSTLEFPPGSKPLVVAAARQELEILREEAEVAVDEILFSPSRRSTDETIMVNDRLNVTFDEALFPHLVEFEQRDSSVDLNRFEFTRLSTA